VIAIASGEVLVGGLPARALKLVAEWADLHRGELEVDWVRAKGDGTPEPVDPLPQNETMDCRGHIRTSAWPLPAKDRLRRWGLA
jgi:hypothetical protein